MALNEVNIDRENTIIRLIKSSQSDPKRPRLLATNMVMFAVAQHDPIQKCFESHHFENENQIIQIVAHSAILRWEIVFDLRRIVQYLRIRRGPCVSTSSRARA